jgi:hypothetical protein
MSLKERLKDFAGSVSLAATDAPDGYATWSSWTYESHMSDLKDLWGEIRPLLKRDVDQAQAIDTKLGEMFSAFGEAIKKEDGKRLGLYTTCTSFNSNEEMTNLNFAECSCVALELCDDMPLTQAARLKPRESTA